MLVQKAILHVNAHCEGYVHTVDSRIIEHCLSKSDVPMKASIDSSGTLLHCVYS